MTTSYCMVRLKFSAIALLCTSTVVFTSMAVAADWADPARFESKDGGFVFQTGIGYTFLKGNEFVYDAAGNRISHLIWESDAPIFTAKAKAALPGQWTIGGSLTIGGWGNSHMEDYDWELDDYTFENWSHQSIHPDTDLDRYITTDIAVGRIFHIDANATLNLHGGFKYTNVKWNAYGGSFIYSSDGGFRNEVGNIPDGTPVISWEQHYPGFFLGAEATATSGAWTFSGLARGGLTAQSKAIDHHWRRKLRFKDEYNTIPFLSLEAQLDYAFNSSARIFLAGSFDQYFHKKGDTTIYDIPSGGDSGPLVDGAGMKFRAATITGGLKIAF